MKLKKFEEIIQKNSKEDIKGKWEQDAKIKLNIKMNKVNNLEQSLESWKELSKINLWRHQKNIEGGYQSYT